MSGVDVVVVGAGPAGWVVADRCARLGLSTTLVDPDPYRRWRATYGMWVDQVCGLPAGVRTRPCSVRAMGSLLNRGYAMLDNDSAMEVLSGGEVRTVADSVVDGVFGDRGATVVLRSGRRLAAAVVIDASGARRVLSGRHRTRVAQTAFGVVVDDVWGEDVFMDDWVVRDGAATFLYRVPMADGRVLVEETSLAREPALPIRELRARLLTRLSAEGVRVPDDVVTETVHIPLDVPPPRRSGAVAFGVAAGMVHPATGYSVGDAVDLAPRVAEAIAGADRPSEAVARARAVVWSPEARAVRMLRARSARALLGLPPERVGEFFRAFFELPDAAQRAYLSGREDVRGTAAAMATLFRSAPWRIRLTMATSW